LTRSSGSPCRENGRELVAPGDRIEELARQRRCRNPAQGGFLAERPPGLRAEIDRDGFIVTDTDGEPRAHDAQEHPVVVPHSSQTMQWPATRMRADPQMSHMLPVYPAAFASAWVKVAAIFGATVEVAGDGSVVAALERPRRSNPALISTSACCGG
jgi:hypothetical protein